ncbi:AMP-binding enzyme domain-containing protein [Ditylenchus destructor]|nr:AMP-binding enzyme domain-containing protein [Ditylenchus destructor]
MPISSDFPPVEVPREPFSHTFVRALWEHFSHDPHRAALINARNESDRVTFGELYVYSHAVAAFLKSKGFGYKDIACVALPNCWEFVAIFGGITLQGSTMSGANHNFTHYELQRQFIDSTSKIVFCADENLSTAIRAARDCPRISTIVVVKRSKNATVDGLKRLNVDVVDFNTVLRTEPLLSLPQIKHDVDRDILILPYSSGTTGQSKGVMTSHRNFGTMMKLLTNHNNTNILPYIDKDFVYHQEHQLLMLPFYHIYGFGIMINCLLNGSTGVVLDSFHHETFCQSIEKYQFRFLMIVPPVLIWLVKSDMVHNYNFGSISLLFSGAAPAGRDLCLKLKKKFPSLKHIAQGYGMTELSLGSNFPVLDKDRFESSGKLLSNLEMKIIDLVTGEEVDQGMPGELYIRGPNVMMGYFNRPEATAEAIDKDGWLRTGDVGYLDKEGFLYVVDRRKELIKVKGFQVPPAELEDLLLSHPAIKDCAVVGIPDKYSGELPKAFVVKNDESLTEHQVMDFVKDRLAYYKHLKGGVAFVSEIPKSPSGKILRRLLRSEKIVSKL